MYVHAERFVYGIFSVVNDFSINQYFFGFITFLGSVIFLSLEDSLGNLLKYDEGDDDVADETSPQAQHAHPVLLFGVLDKDMVTCFSLPMTVTVGKYRIHFARLLYYNLHGVLFTLAWCGIDSTIGRYEL